MRQFAAIPSHPPSPASQILEKQRGLITDPSLKVARETSKIIIDATKQWAEEGGKEVFPETNRALLQKDVPGVFEEVDRLFGTQLTSWGADTQTAVRKA